MTVSSANGKHKYTIAIIQARFSSSRLPGKVLLDIAGKPMLQWVVERTLLAKAIDEVVVATTIDASDDAIAAFCAEKGYTCTRGSLHDVLDRYVQTARQLNAGVIVRLTADCPLLDPDLLDQTVAAHRGLDFIANRLPAPWGRSFPIGLDVEVATAAVLERAWAETTEKHHREHVMPYLYDDLPDDAFRSSEAQLSHTITPRGFKVGLLHNQVNYGDLRWTVDTAEDLAAVRAIAALLPDSFDWMDVVHLWQAHPEIAAINADVQHKTSKDIDDRMK
jgi:spore coat polysaccharide biosynthesis protein SpsF